MVYELEALFFGVLGLIPDVIEELSTLLGERLQLCLEEFCRSLLLNLNVVDFDGKVGQPVFHFEKLFSGKRLHVANLFNSVAVVFEHLPPDVFRIFLK